MREPPVEQRNSEGTETFARLVNEHQKAVFALAYGKVRNVHDAEDIMQEVFAEAYRKSSSLKNPDKVSAWLFKATLYRCKDHIRKMSRRRRRELKYADTLETSNEVVFDSDPSKRVLEAIGLLPEKYRIVVMLKHFARLSYAEISDITGLSKTTIDGRLRSAKTRLRMQIIAMNKGAD